MLLAIEEIKEIKKFCEISENEDNTSKTVGYVKSSIEES